MRNHTAWPACNSIRDDKNVNIEYYVIRNDIERWKRGKRECQVCGGFQ